MRDKGDSAFDDVVEEDTAESDDDPKADTSSSPQSDTPSSSVPDKEPERRSQTSEDTHSESATGTSESSSATETPSQPPEEQPATVVSDSTPAFPYTEVTQRPVYAREQTWNRVEDLKYYADGVLREESGVRNAETREFDEALAELISEKLSPEELAAKVVQLRGFES